MENFEKNIRDFFVYVVKFIRDWNECANDSKAILKGLQNQAEQLFYVQSWNSGLLETLPDVKDRLLHKILYGLEEESKGLRDIWSKLALLKNELQSKLDLIERSTKKICLAGPISSGMIVPPIYKMIEYAEDVVRYYSSVFIILASALESVDYLNERTIQHIGDVLHKSCILPDNVKENAVKLLRARVVAACKFNI